jgi:hypothetical protein
MTAAEEAVCPHATDTGPNEPTVYLDGMAAVDAELALQAAAIAQAEALEHAKALQAELSQSDEGTPSPPTKSAAALPPAPIPPAA